MSRERDLHFDEEMLVHALVDERDLLVSLRQHLLECPECLRRKEEMERGLNHFAKMIRSESPSPRSIFQLPDEASRSDHWWSWGFSFGFVARVAMIVLISLVVASSLFRSAPQETVAMLEQEMQEDDMLITEITMLEENALPPLYDEISDEFEVDLEEDFMDFIVPSSSQIIPHPEDQQEGMPC